MPESSGCGKQETLFTGVKCVKPISFQSYFGMKRIAQNVIGEERKMNNRSFMLWISI